MQVCKRAMGLGAAVITMLACVPTAASAQATGTHRLTATSTGSSYAPTFTGNGLLGVRVPPAGQGYSGGTVPAQSELAGFYAQPPGGVQQRANIPTWSTLTFTDGGAAFDPGAGPGKETGWRQTIDFKTGVITTTATWTAPNGHVTDLTYQVLTDRARQHVGLVRLTLTPHWSGTATVADIIDGTPANLTTQTTKGWDMSAHRDWVGVQTQGTNITAGLASQVQTSADLNATYSQTDQSTPQSVGQQLSFPVTPGRSYTITKYVAVDSSQDASDPVASAQAQAAAAAGIRFNDLKAASDAAWAKLWASDIEVLGNPALATMVNASQFYLWSSTGPNINWSVSPAGLSSNGYDGHIFWDAETWMYPSLLAQHPELAIGMDNYRFERLQAAIQHAAATGYKGARFPWESALDGTEQIPPPVSVNSEGLYEQHITADIALAQWQYYLVSGDRTWLAQRGWPVLSQAAAFWASRVTKAADGSYHIDGVTGPDEENPNVNDEAYTNVAAKTTLEDAVAAAHVLGLSAPPDWSQIASGIVVLFNPKLQIHPEFAGYGGQLVKQADVTLLQYPWSYPMPATVAANDINYYVPRTDPTGPSMSDAVNSIDTSALGTPGCASYVYTQRSYQPFIKDVFDQFSETRTGGAFTFMTGIGGFLQEFLYGYSGLRWAPSSISLDPSLTAQLGGVTLRGISWRGRRFTIAVGRQQTTVHLDSGPAMPISTSTGAHVLATGATLSLPTKRPDRIRTSDVLQCEDAAATSSQAGAPALAAVDGSPATDWQPQSLPTTLDVSAPASGTNVTTATVRWGRLWPPAPGPNIPPPPGPVTTLRASAYTLSISDDGQHWHTVATVSGRTTGTLDVFHFPAQRAKFARLTITAGGTDTQPPMLEELALTG